MTSQDPRRQIQIQIEHVPDVKYIYDVTRSETSNTNTNRTYVGRQIHLRLICKHDSFETANCRLRPYHDEYTRSRLITEVKHRRAGIVLGWGTAWELPVP